MTNLKRNEFYGVHFCFFFVIVVAVAVTVDTMKNALECENKIKYHLFCLNVIHRNRMQWCCSLFRLTHRVMERRQQVESITLTLMTTNEKERNKLQKKDNTNSSTHTSVSHLISRRISMRNGSTNTYACMLPDFVSISFSFTRTVC